MNENQGPNERKMSEAFIASYQKPEIIEGGFLAVETDNGTSIVPLAVVDDMPTSIHLDGVPITPSDEPFDEEHPDLFDVLYNKVKDHVTGIVVMQITPCEGVAARTSAPGFMDATDWVGFENREEAAAYLIDEFTDDESI